MKLYNKKKG